MTRSYDVDAYVVELRARITELEAELAHERTLRRASTAGPGPKPGSWKSQFLAVVARAERVEAAWQDSEKHVIEIAERLTREQARAEKAEAECEELRGRLFPQEVWHRGISCREATIALKEAEARVAEQEGKIIELAERLTKEQARVAELERMIHRSRPHRFVTGVCQDCNAREREAE